MKSSFAESMKRAIVTYRKAQLAANGPTVDTAREVISQGRGGHGKHGQRSAHLAFARDLPLSVEMERSFARWCDVWERQLHGVDRTLSARGATTGARKAREDRAILDAVGLDPTALAFMYRRTTEGVRKLRLRHGLDPDTGERRATPAPLTSRAVAQAT